MNDTKLNIVGYFVHEDDKGLLDGASVMAVIDDERKGWFTCYCPIGQHSLMSAEYLNECNEITKDDYLKASEGIYTPEDYLV